MEFRRVQKRHLSKLLIAGAAVVSMLANPMTALADGVTTSTPDTAAPTFTSITIDPTSTSTPGTYTATISGISDDISGFCSVEVELRYDRYNEGIYVGGSSIRGTVYADGRTGSSGTYSDGVATITLTPGEYSCTGEYLLEVVKLTDNAGNYKTYINSHNPQYNLPDDELEAHVGKIPAASAGLSVTYTNTGTEDCTGPTLTSVSISPTSGTYPDTFTVTISGLEDDASGVQGAVVYFKNTETGDYIESYFTRVSDGEIRINIDPHNAPSGTYAIEDVYLEDNAGNGRSYFGRCADGYEIALYTLPESCADLSFEYTQDENADLTPPTVTSISFSPESGEAPCKTTLSVAVTEEGSGITGAGTSKWLHLTNRERGQTKLIFLRDSDYSDGVFTTEIDFDQYSAPGKWEITYLFLVDKAMNQGRYQLGASENDAAHLPMPNEASFMLVNNGSVADVTTSTSNSNIIEQINSVPEDGLIVADFTAQPEISADIFTAIAGTNKTIVFTSGGISWEFNGTDIDASAAKSINLSTTITKVNQQDAKTAGAIENLIGKDNNALVIQFADNGKLPGKTKMHIKSDYAIQQYLGTTGLEVFYWDQANNTMVPVASNVSVDKYDDILFDTDHNSYYIIKGRETTKEDKHIPEDANKDVPAGYEMLFRLYNPNSGEHFYTISRREGNKLIDAGWNYEGEGWTAPTEGDPVYRLYNKNAGDHHYTTSKKERDKLISAGWTDEGIGWYSESKETGKPLYRLYNPNATGAGSHHYTTSTRERDKLVQQGWNDEGIAWYGLNK